MAAVTTRTVAEVMNTSAVWFHAGRAGKMKFRLAMCSRPDTIRLDSSATSRVAPKLRSNRGAKAEGPTRIEIAPAA